MEQKQQAEKPTRITLTRNIQASPAALFDAFADSDKMSEWFYQEGQWSAQVANQFLESGEYMCMLFREDGQSQVIQGIYREIVADQRIIFSWDSDRVQGSMVVIEFRESDNGTELNMLQEGLANAELQTFHQSMWEELLTHLAEYVEG